ncbi:MAG: glycosyltransferase [Candidatus Sifarchaeia archaeon]
MQSEHQSLSVIVPVRNSGRTVSRTFESILSQTIKPEKIVVVFDDSSDNSLDVINKYIEAYPHTFVLIHGPGKGIGAARQEAIRAVKTQFVSFLDSDDWYVDDALESLLSGVRKTGAVCGLVQEVYETGRQRTRYPEAVGHLIDYERLKKGNPIPMSTTMYQTSLLREIGGFDRNLLWIEDYDLHLRIAKVVPYFFANKIIAYYSTIENPTLSTRTYEYAKWTAIVWLKNGFIDWKSIWHSLAYSVTSLLLVPINIIKNLFKRNIRVFHYEYLQILAGYVTGLVTGYHPRYNKAEDNRQ